MLGVIVVVVILGVMLFGVTAGGFIAFTGHTQKKAEANAPQILDEAFDGRPDVVFKVNAESPKYETVVLGAKERGYRLAHERDNVASGLAKTLIFERI